MPQQQPQQKPILSSIAMPANTNVNGDIFGGWLLSHMDLAGAAFCRTHAKCRVVTIAIDSMRFLVPVHVGDTVSCYCTMKKIGRTSMTTHIEVWTDRFHKEKCEKVTTGTFTYVAIDDNHNPTPVPKSC